MKVTTSHSKKRLFIICFCVSIIVGVIVGFMIFSSDKPIFRTRLAIAGSGSDTVVIIDKQTQEVIQKIPLPERDSECNSVEVDKNGSVLFSYRRGAQMVSRYGDIIWDMVRGNENEEVQTATIIDNGYLLGVCGNPSQIIEVDRLGNKTKVIKFNTGISNPHNQFRQIKKSKSGNYLVPLMGKEQLLEIDSMGRVVDSLPIGGFSVVELEDGNLMISTGRGLLIVDRQTDAVIKNISIPKGSFITEANLLNNGNLIISNWQGHNGSETKLEWMIIELTPQGEIVWEYKDQQHIKYISAIAQFEGLVEE